MNSLRCANCSLLNFDTASACKRCGLPFDSQAEHAAGAHPYAPAQQYPQPAEGDSYFWDQPQYQPSYIPPRPAPRPSGIGKTIAGVAVFLVTVSLVAFVAIPRLLTPKKADLTNVTWSEYKAPDGSFTVSLPATPKESQMNQPTPVGNAKMRLVTAEIGRDAGCMVMYVDYPVLSKVSEDELYEQTIKGMASPNSEHLGIGNRKFIRQDGHRGIEVEFKPKVLERLDAKGRARMFWVAPRLYMVLSGGPETPEFAGISDRCLDSFKFNYGR